ncbi:MAG TPA: DUF4395 domain-containing protein [Actinomycetes bacterium]|nr:DUF4395 domain-containing protein [Actinomycetes bacterium]
MSQSLDRETQTKAATVDPRGPRFAAAVTAAVLAAVLILSGSPLGFVLLLGQTAVFALGALRGPQRTPYAAAFRRFVRPRLGPPVELEDVRPLRFAQSVGLFFGLLGLLGFLLAPVVGLVAVGAAFVAAFLNAAFGYCLGCEMYLILRRIQPASTSN